MPNPARLDPTRQRGGAVARVAGQTFEEELRGAGAWYAGQRRGVLFKTNPMVAGFSQGFVKIVGKGPPDLLGVIDGMPVCADAKTTHGGASYQHPPKTRHQLQSMLDFAAGGGVAGVLVQCRVLHVVWFLANPADLRTLAEGGRVSLRTAKGHGFVHHHPFVVEPPLADVVRGLTPTWDVAALFHHARGCWRNAVHVRRDPNREDAAAFPTFRDAGSET